MKVRISKDRREKRELLVIKTTKGETLDYAQAELLASSQAESMLPFRYETERQGETRFSYDVTDMVPLETFLKADLSLPQFRSMLDDVIGSFEWCAAQGLDPARLLFEQHFLRLDARSDRLAFAYVPALGLPADRATAMDLLIYIAEHASFVCGENEADAASLLDYLRRQTVFSAVEFKTFLESTAFRKGRAPVQPADAPGQRRAASGPTTASNPFAGLSERKGSGDSGHAKPGGVFDFVKAQSGSLSAHDARARQSFAEQVTSDVAEASPQPRQSPQRLAASATEGAASTSLLASAPLDRACAADEEPADKGAPRLALVRVSDGTRYDLEPDDEITLGRSKRCTVRIADNPSVSRVHAALSVRGDAWFLTDQGSLNRTFVDGEALEPLAPTRVDCGTAFLIADEAFELIDVSSSVSRQI